ncbi:MAG: hypothetical protein K2X86_02900 [Cytophagaceae bacterium]|nr:hypothetical protein [Cytophagaceae bacterium]
MMRRIIFLLFTLITLHVQAQKTIVLTDSLKEFIFEGESYMILEDKEHKLSIEDMQKPEIQQRFVLNKKAYSYNENITSTYWIKFKAVKKARFDRNFVFESYSPHSDDLRLYIPYGDNKWLEKRGGKSLFFYDREYVNKNLVFGLALDTGRIQTFYVKVYSENHSSFDYRIKPINYFTFYNTSEYFFLGIYYGILAIMGLYNLLLFFSIREKVYVYYVLYVVAGMLSTLTDDSLGYQYVWFNFPELNTIIGHHIAPLLLLSTFVLYSREFLHLKDSFPKFDRIVVICTVVYFVYYIIQWTILPKYLHFRGMYLLPFIAVYIVGIRCFMEGYKPARFFIIGYTIIFFSIIITILLIPQRKTFFSIKTYRLETFKVFVI